MRKIGTITTAISFIFLGVALLLSKWGFSIYIIQILANDDNSVGIRISLYILQK